jgi:hypothetical protein
MQNKSNYMHWAITTPKDVSFEKGHVWFNNISRQNKVIIIKEIRKTFKHRTIHYFQNMIVVEGVWFHHNYCKLGLKKFN